MRPFHQCSQVPFLRVTFIFRTTCSHLASFAQLQNGKKVEGRVGLSQMTFLFERVFP